MNNTLKITAICVLIFSSAIAVVTPVYVHAQLISTLGCESKKDELKDRTTDLMLVFFAPSMSTWTISDFIDEGNALVIETEQEIIDCADYLTGTEIQMLRGMQSAAAFFVCMTDLAINVTSSADTKELMANCLEPAI